MAEVKPNIFERGGPLRPGDVVLAFSGTMAPKYWLGTWLRTVAADARKTRPDVPVIVIGLTRPGADEAVAACLAEIKRAAGESIPDFRLIEFAHEDADRAWPHLPLDVPDAVIALLDAERWRFPGIKPNGPSVQMPDGATIHVSDKDGVALPHVEKLVLAICESAPKAGQKWLIASRGFGFEQTPPALQKLGNLDIMQASTDDTWEKTGQFRKILGQIKTTGVEPALAWVEANLPAGKTAEIAKANVWSLADRPIDAYQAIAGVEKEIVAEGRPEEILQLAQMAMGAGKLSEAGKALKLLPNVAMLDLESLRAARLLASQVDDSALEELYLANLKARFPREPLVLLHSYNELLNEGKFDEAEKQAEETGYPFRRIVARFWGGKSTAEEMLAAAKEAGELTEAYWILAKQAKRQKNYVACRDYAYRLADDEDRKGQAMELFARALGQDLTTMAAEELKDDFGRLLHFCAHSPAELAPRFELEALFDNTSTARGSLAIISILLVEEMERIAHAYDPAAIPAESQLEQDAPSDPQAFKAFSRRLLEANAGRPLIVGAGQLSAEEVKNITPSLWSDMGIAVMQTKADAANAAIFLNAVLLMAAATNDPASDIVAVREVSANLAESKTQQKALDLAEGMLTLLPARPVGHKSARLSAAWLNYADVVLRMHNVKAALRFIYFAAVVLQEPPTHRRSYLDLFRVAARVARELHLAPLAFQFIALEAGHLECLQEGQERARQLDQLVLSIQLQQWKPADGPDAALAIARAALDLIDQGEDEIAPLVSVAAQAVQFHRMLAEETPADVRERLEQCVQRVPRARQELVRSLVKNDITAAELRRLAGSIVRASGDWSLALAPALVAARNALSMACAKGDIELFWTACLIICQPGLAVRPAEKVVGPAEGDPIVGAKWMARQIEAGGSVADAVMVQRELSNASDESIGKKLFEVSLKEFLELIEPDEAVVLLGTDNLHRLYRCELRRGAAAPPQKVGAAEWDYTRFHAWKVEYPRKYGMDVQIYYGHLRGPAPGQVAETIAGLLPAGRFGTKLGTIVTEGRLFSFAHRLAAEIAGDHTATTVAPSARWLAGMRRSELKGAGAVAWLASAPAGDQAMGTLYAELPAVFAQSGIARLESGILPDLASRKLVVIGCHGRGSNQEGFVQLMDGDTAYEPDAVANRVADSTVVVLFVCHGGRGDEALYSHETAGLTSSLLRHGVRAVVAALWPLDASLAAPWLEEFGKTDRGASVVERVDQAQRAVARRPAFAERFGEHPLVKTAFTVFGDGVVRLDWPE